MVGGYEAKEGGLLRGREDKKGKKLWKTKGEKDESQAMGWGN
ncbi:hypothetical protein C8R28_105611, partial [Nitrosomonas ureae]